METQRTFFEKVWEQKGKYVSVVASVVISFLFVFLSVYGATTVSTNLSTTGTLGVTGLSTFAGFITTASSTAVSTLRVNDAFAASSTLQATGNSIFFGTLSVGATSTPALGEVGIAGDVTQSTSGTTTHLIDSSGTGKGGCIQLKTTGGAWVKLYATSTNSGYLSWSAGSCQDPN